jgi:hypothetical protein
MNAEQLFNGLAPLIEAEIERVFHRRDLATRLAIDVAKYFGVQAEPLPCKVMLYNAAFAKHVANNFADVEDKTRPQTWGDDSWSVGIGCGSPKRFNAWDGHLIAVADGWFGDFSIGQAERPQHNIMTGPALVGPYAGHAQWRAESETTGAVIEYKVIEDGSWRMAPDWRDEKRRRPMVGKLIRALRQIEAVA